LAEAPSYGRPIVRYSPESRGAHAYSALADEVLQRHPRSGGITTAAPEMAVTS
jgi:cellulose biosynthesis protein BcsQ